MKLLKTAGLLFSIAAVLASLACTEEVVKEVPVDRVVTQEVVKEIPVEKIVEVEKEVVRTVEVEKPVEVIKEVVKEVEVPGETVVVEKEVVREVPKEVVVKETVVEVVYRDARAGGTLRSNFPGMKTLDIQTAAGPGEVATQTHEGIFARTAAMTSAGVQVDSWEASSDGLTWKFHLREGLKFHNGEPITARDVRGSTERSKDTPGLYIQFYKEFLDNWTELDDNNFQLTLKKKAAFTLDALADGGATPTVPKEIWELPVTQASTVLIGAGPYKLEEWIPGDKTTLSRFDDYIPSEERSSFMTGKKVALIDTIEYIEIPDTAAQIAAIEVGAVDVLLSVGGDFAERLEKHQEVNLINLESPARRLGIWLQHDHLPFSDLRVRKALQLAIDAEDILRGAVGPAKYWRTCASIWSCGTAWETDAGSEVYNVKDLDQARQLVKDAGQEGYEVKFIVGEYHPVLAGSSKVVRDIMESIGLKVDYQAMDNATWRATRADSDNWDALITASVGFYHPYLGATAHLKKEGWLHKYKDDTGRLTALWDKLFADVYSIEETQAIAGDIAKAVYDDVPIVSVGEYFELSAARKDVKGFAPLLWNRPFFNVWLER
jgi:peptide/nickel transport system substrate-binding protein